MTLSSIHIHLKRVNTDTRRTFKFIPNFRPFGPYIQVYTDDRGKKYFVRPHRPRFGTRKEEAAKPSTGNTNENEEEKKKDEDRRGKNKGEDKPAHKQASDTKAVRRVLPLASLLASRSLLTPMQKNAKTSDNDKKTKTSDNDNKTKTSSNDNKTKTSSDDNKTKTSDNDNKTKTSGNDKNNKMSGNDKKNKTSGNDKNNKTSGNDKNNKTSGNDKNEKIITGPFLAADDAWLKKMKAEQMSWKRIAAKMGRAEHEIKTHWKEIRTDDAAPATPKKPAREADEAVPTKHKKSPADAGTAKPKPAPAAPSESEDYITLYEDDFFSAVELRLLADLMMRDDARRWLRISSAFFDKTGRRVHPDDVRERFEQ